MTNFFDKMKKILEDIPSKAKLLEDLGFNNSYVGFRSFLQGKKEQPSNAFMEKICDELDYDYIQVPVKRDEDEDFIARLQDEFHRDLEKHLKKYEGDSVRTHTKNGAGISSVSAAVAAFEIEDELLDPEKKIDVSDLF